MSDNKGIERGYVTMADPVMDFIEHFQNIGTIDIFTEGCCYWFAKILEERFKKEKAEIMYNPIDNHFATLINHGLYDITGPITVTKEWEYWSEYEKLDELETTRIYKYCINKTE
jgi:hypothetical protein